MSSGPRLFKQKDLERALKAMVAAGIKVKRLEIDKTGVALVTDEGKVTIPPRDEWDKEISHDQNST